VSSAFLDVIFRFSKSCGDLVSILEKVGCWKGGLVRVCCHNCPRND
jgi:hypothetical protein